ncbi:hypothetical protein [Sphingobium yanoikuyae]|uniref:hypothetical protein n=1 Tax=Sphingobium yanoikuyae TaxID=13690 RepID=UPI0028DC3675|nr:hypothetical protein [Sphingobium yanoikuyae]
MIEAAVRADRCACGRNPIIRSRVVEDGDVSTWVECPGDQRAGAETIDSARNDAAAIVNWNNGKRKSW